MNSVSAPLRTPDIDAEDLALLQDAAREAGRIATPIWERSHDVWDKGDGAGPVTEADLAVDAMLHETLLAARPNYGWLSEETEDDAARHATRSSAARTFVIDPIDGTRAFTAGERTWAHSLAVVQDGQTVAGIVYLPLHDKLYSARVGHGALLNGAPIQSSRRASLQDATLLAARPALDARHWHDGSPPPMQRHFRASLAYRLALIGEGRFDAMLTLRNSWDWDIAAGALIAQEAGAAVSDRTGAGLRFNSPARQVRGTLACAPALQRPLLDGLAR
jgi:myo-inositol-1(or 4)-monophosphatase